MHLFLFRHGSASSSEPGQQPSLTPKGRKEVTLVAQHFLKKKIKLSEIWHSPKARALQSAEIFKEVHGDPSLPMEEWRGLEPEGEVGLMALQIREAKTDSLLVVSHLPLIVDLAYHFAEKSTNPNISFPTAGVAAFEGQGENWKWLWSLDPSTLG